MSTTRYTSFADSIARIVPIPGSWGGYAIVQPKRVPEPVRAVFREVHKCGVTEVDFDNKTREVKVVPYWERRHI